MKIYLALTLLALGSSVTATSDCGSGVTADDVCYFVMTSPYGVSKEEAMTECASAGATLAVIPSGPALTAIGYGFLIDYGMEMILTALEYDHTENPKFPLLPNGDKIPYKPDWFQGHPIKQKGHSEIVYIPNRNEKFSGFMNIADGARFVYFLCAK